MGVREPTREDRETASIIPVPTTIPNRGSVFNKKFAERLINVPQRNPKIVPLSIPTNISFLRYALYYLLEYGR